MAFNLGEYQEIFLEEADEQIQELNQNLLELEKKPGDDAIINNIFRAAHSLKSSAAFVGLHELSDLAHKMENLLQGIRDKTLAVNTDIINVLFKSFDYINSIINTVAEGKKPEVDLSGIIAQIQAAGSPPKSVSTGKAAGVTVPEPRREAPVVERKLTLSGADVQVIRQGLGDDMHCYELAVHIDPSALMKSIKAQLIINNLERIATLVSIIPNILDENIEFRQDSFTVIVLTEHPLADIQRACEVDLIHRVELRRISIARVDNRSVLKCSDRTLLFEEALQVVEKTAPVAEAPAYDDSILAEVPEPDRTHAGTDVDEAVIETEKKNKEDVLGISLQTVKVSVDKLDNLLNNVGELVIANSGFYKLYEEMRKHEYNKTLVNEFRSRIEQMSRIAKDLQGGIMKTRMVPIGQVFSRFKRLVRDLSAEFNKKTQLLIKGEDTELDKKVIDYIGDPILHLIRNAIDHGIEPAEERKNLRKNEVATITLNAYQGGNQIFVEVSDDGRGLNIENIKKKAIERGLVTSDLIGHIDNDDIFNFILAPGFSTAEVVTDISGRGVGMNVVKEVVNELNGSLHIETEPGMGTRFLMSFPLTLAIIPAIMVKVRKEMYALPLADVIETIKIAQGDIRTIEGHEVINLRGEILSILRLNEFVAIDSALGPDEKNPVVVVGFGNRKIGLVVDYLEGKQEIVIKSLEQNYMTVDGLAGASILGDGSICLILDINSMINKVVSDKDFLANRSRRRFMEKIVPEVGAESVETKAEPVPVRQDIRAPEVAEKKAPVYEFAAIAPEPKREKSAGGTVVPVVRSGDDDRVIRNEIRPVERVPEARVTEAVPVTADIAAADDQLIEDKVKSTLDDFRQQLLSSIKGSAQSVDPGEHIKRALDLTGEDIARVQVLANIGITNAAESLSKIINKRIDLSIPDVEVLPLDHIPESIGEIDNVYIGVYMPLLGDIKGTILFTLHEDSAYDLISLLYGIERSNIVELDEDGESALTEVTNIIGSSVINIFAEKIGLAIKPSVPTIAHDYMQSIIDSILVMHNIENDFALIMDTEFYYRDDKVIGNLLILPEIESLRKIIEKLKK